MQQLLVLVRAMALAQQLLALEPVQVAQLPRLQVEEARQAQQVAPVAQQVRQHLVPPVLEARPLVRLLPAAVELQELQQVALQVQPPQEELLEGRQAVQLAEFTAAL